ncbi:ABC transporter substrate-binding protein (plasmid) [Paraburkholderia graminis]|uniref:ABC transporter substrate-binding protein n=1 Tax=Paraburkholderia graminis TaxID=60548 RepID=UPI000DEEC971|nr:ABC transporter substrate-binding protein [Paraburkholderia graminis]AXF12546.1 ABC transporter substrate-binding protein [Paraburkholderia graminis]
MKEFASKAAGMSRREMMRLMAGAGALAVGAGFGTMSGLAIAESAPKRGGNIRLAYDSMSTSDTLDPAKGSTGSDYIRFFMFYSGLTQLDRNLTPQMNLAESIESKDGTAWIVKLRKGVTFHDGSPLTPADVAWSLMRHKLPSTASKVKTLADQFKDAIATGPNELTLILVSPNADLPTILATPQLVILKAGATDFTSANGTGPYQVKSFKPGISTLGVRNPNYWKPGLPYLDQVEMIGIGDDAARANALLAGDVHLIDNVDPRATKRISSAAGYTLLETKSGEYSDLIMRKDNTITGNPDFVMGMKYLFDRDQIRTAVFRDCSMIGNDQPVPSFHRYFNATLPQRQHDPDKAKFHFTKARALGVSLPPIYAAPTANGSVDMAQLLQQSGSKIGLNLSINRVPSDGYWSNHWMKHPLSFGNIGPRASVDALFTQFFRSDAAWNESGWSNAKFDQLLLAARSETDDAKRKQMYGDMQEIVSNSGLIGIPAFISLLDAHDNRLHGLESIPSGPLMGYSFAEYTWWSA